MLRADRWWMLGRATSALEGSLPRPPPPSKASRLAEHEAELCRLATPFTRTGSPTAAACARSSPTWTRSPAELSETFRTDIARVARLVDSMLVDGAGYRVIQPILGVGPLLAATFVAEIGDISRFASAAQVCCKLTGERSPHVHPEVKGASSEAVRSFADQ